MAIFEYVSQNVRWNQQYGDFATQAIRTTLDTKLGNVADINLTLVAMFLEAGLEAYPVILSTRRNGRVNTFYPSLTQFNYVVAAVKLEDNYEFFDAMPGILPPGGFRPNA